MISPPDHAGRRRPTTWSRPELVSPPVVEVGDVERAGEVLAEVVARAHLQRLAVAASSPRR